MTPWSNEQSDNCYHKQLSQELLSSAMKNFSDSLLALEWQLASEFQKFHLSLEGIQQDFRKKTNMEIPEE